MQRSNDQFTLLAVAPAVVLGLLIGFMLGGCSDIYFDRRDTISLAAGDAMAINRVTMMTDPWPPPSANKNIAFSGDRMQCAVERYRIHRVLPPASGATSTVYGAGATAVVAPPTPGCPPPWVATPAGVPKP